jgi:hypothetical protein
VLTCRLPATPRPHPPPSLPRPSSPFPFPCPSAPPGPLRPRRLCPSPFPVRPANLPVLAAPSPSTHTPSRAPRPSRCFFAPVSSLGLPVLSTRPRAPPENGGPRPRRPQDTKKKHQSPKRTQNPRHKRSAESRESRDRGREFFQGVMGGGVLLFARTRRDKEREQREPHCVCGVVVTFFSFAIQIRPPTDAMTRRPKQEGRGEGRG